MLDLNNVYFIVLDKNIIFLLYSCLYYLCDTQYFNINFEIFIVRMSER